MVYKVFLVEDEIVTREGIRDNVDWGAAGFELCGEASDGESALRLIQDAVPDVLITDIKMPFMDGLQLSRLVQEHMPWIKIIILSGHDEFDYAQTAVKLGVTEYLLKPISSQDLHQVLVRVAKVLDREKLASEKMKEMQNTVADSMVFSRERFLLDLVMGLYSSAEAFEQSKHLGMDILGRFFVVALVRIELCDPSQLFDYRKYRLVEQIVSEFASTNLDVFLTKKDFEELVLFIKGDDKEQLMAETDFLLDLIDAEIKKQTDCNIEIVIGSVQDRLGSVHLSFLDALKGIKSFHSTRDQSPGAEQIALVRIDHRELENYLKFGTLQEYDEFFEQVILPVGEVALRSDLMKQYLFVDLTLATNQFLVSLLVNDEKYATELISLTSQLDEVTSIEQIKQQAKVIIQNALQRRNTQVDLDHLKLIERVKNFLEKNLDNPEIKLKDVAEICNLTPNYFSTFFHQEMGQTFREYVASMRMGRAKELLRTTNLKISDIAYRSGYKDSHYFSQVFKKNTGHTPSQFRGYPLVAEEEE